MVLTRPSAASCALQDRPVGLRHDRVGNARERSHEECRLRSETFTGDGSGEKPERKARTEAWQSFSVFTTGAFVQRGQLLNDLAVAAHFNDGNADLLRDGCPDIRVLSLGLDTDYQRVWSANSAPVALGRSCHQPDTGYTPADPLAARSAALPTHFGRLHIESKPVRGASLGASSDPGGLNWARRSKKEWTCVSRILPSANPVCGPACAPTELQRLKKTVSAARSSSDKSSPN